MNYLLRVGRHLVLLLGMLVLARPAAAQDQDVVRLILGYTGGELPGVVVMTGPGLDSVRTIVHRDLTYSGRFTMRLPDSLGVLTGALDPTLLRGSGTAWVIEIQPVGTEVEVMLHDLTAGVVARQQRLALNRGGVGDARLDIHRLADRLVLWMTGSPGIAATRILYKQDPPGEEGLYRIDYDGENRVRIPTTSPKVVTPTWSPTGEHIAYGEFRDAIGNIVIRTMASGTRVTLPKLAEDWNATYFDPAFSPDMKELLFTRSGEGRFGQIYRANIANLSGICCLEPRTTVAISVRPAYSPDGRTVAFEGTRAGINQIFRMDADGTQVALLVDQGLGARFHAPAWSPDGLKVAYEREDAQGRPQIHVMEIATRRVIQITSTSSNEGPSWAPDSRHLVFRSKRGGATRLWIWDTERHEGRALATPGGEARYPAWSPTLGGPLP